MPQGLRELRVLLRLLTVVSGMVDAVSFLGLGRVLTANVTGNILLLGFAAAGASGFSTIACIVSLLAFVAGALLSGRLYHALGAGRRWFLVALTIESGLLALAATAAAITGATPTSDSRLVVIAVLALAMGGRNATIQLLAIPGMSTTLMTATLTGLAIDSRLAGHPFPAERFRWTGVLAIAAGGFAGAILFLSFGPGLPLAVAAAGQFAITFVFARSSSSQVLDRLVDERPAGGPLPGPR